MCITRPIRKCCYYHFSQIVFKGLICLLVEIVMQEKLVFDKDVEKINYTKENVSWSKNSSSSILQHFLKFSYDTIISRGIHTLDFSRKTTNAVLSDLQIADVVK